jgi:hypothetical protein
MKAKAFIVGCAAAASMLPFVSFAAPVESVKPAPLARGGPRIIQIPEAPKAEPKSQPRGEARPEPQTEPRRHVEQPRQQPEAAKPAPSQAPAVPSTRAPAPTKSNRKIWIELN